VNGYQVGLPIASHFPAAARIHRIRRRAATAHWRYPNDLAGKKDGAGILAQERTLRQKTFARKGYSTLAQHLSAGTSLMET